MSAALCERLLRATEEATQYKALAAAELARLQRRGFWGRVFGGK